MKAFLGMCLLFSLVSPVVLVSCRTCKNGSGAECTRTDIKKCESHNKLCKSAIADGNVLINTSQALYMCGRPGICDPGHYSFTTAGDRYFNLVVKCCNTDNCNAELLKFPSEPMPPNGGECSGCYAKRKEKCTGSEVVKCLGNQTKCINMNLFVVSGIKDYPMQIAIRGCGTPDMCHERKVLRSMQLPKFNGNKISVKCSDAV